MYELILCNICQQEIKGVPYQFHGGLVILAVAGANQTSELIKNLLMRSFAEVIYNCHAV